MDIYSKFASWIVPFLISAVGYFVVRYFNKHDEKMDENNQKIDEIFSKIYEKFEALKDAQNRLDRDIREKLIDNSTSMIEVQKVINQEIVEIRAISVEIKNQMLEMEKFVGKQRDSLGKILHFETQIERHEKALLSAGKIVKNHSQRLDGVESSVKLIKKRMEKNDEEDSDS